jgi:hypothetical protein
VFLIFGGCASHLFSPLKQFRFLFIQYPKAEIRLSGIFGISCNIDDAISKVKQASFAFFGRNHLFKRGANLNPSFCKIPEFESYKK